MAQQQPLLLLKRRKDLPRKKLELEITNQKKEERKKKHLVEMEYG
jgi:hypothetical protein